SWPGWRGDGSGVSSETDLPQTWSARANQLWIAAIPGEGLSSPIVWQDRVFVTTAAYEPDWQWPSSVLLALFTLLVPFVVLSYLACMPVRPWQPTARGRRFTRGALLILTFLAVAYVVPIVLDQVRARFPTLSVRLIGKTWQFSSEHSRHVRADDFVAGF